MFKNIWIGKVEDINDPLRKGRIRVRVSGVHDVYSDENSTKDEKTGRGLPTEDLPWAICLYPVTYGGTVPPPQVQVGAVVVGMALDDMFQELLVLGRISGVLNATSINPSNYDTSSLTSTKPTTGSTSSSTTSTTTENLQKNHETSSIQV